MPWTKIARLIATLTGAGLLLVTLWLQQRTAARRSAWESWMQAPETAPLAATSIDAAQLGWLDDPVSRRLRLDVGAVSEAVWLDAARVVSASSRDRLQVWSTADGEMLSESRAHRRGIRCVAVSPDGRWIASGGPDRTVQIHAVGATEPRHVLRGHESPVVSVAWTADGAKVVSVSLHAEVCVWDSETGDRTVRRAGPRSGVLCVRVLDRGDVVVWAAAGGILRLWDALTGECRFRGRDVQVGRVSSLAVDRERRFLATASSFAPSSLRFYDLRDGALLGAPEDVPGAVTAIAFARGSSLLAVATDRGVLQLWDVRSGREAWRGAIDAGAVHLAFAPADLGLMASGPGGAIQLLLPGVKGVLPSGRDPADVRESMRESSR